MILRELIARIKLDTKGATAKLKKYDKALDEVAKKTEAVTKSTKKAGDATEAAAKKTERSGKKIKRTWNDVAKSAKEAATKAGKAGKTIGGGLAVVTAAVTAAAAGVFEFTSSWADATAKIGVDAGKLNAATGGLQELQFVAKNTGAEAEGINDALKEIQVRAAEAVLTGMGPFAEASEVLGLNFIELAKKSPVDAFAEIRTELSKVDDTFKRAFLAEELLGEQGVELGNILNLTEKEFEALRKKARETGQVLSGETIDSAAEFNKELRETKDSISAVTNEVAAELLPVVQELVVEFREWIKENDELLKDDLAKTLGETARAGAEIVKVFGQVLSLTNDVNDATGGLTNTLKALGAVAVGIKLATFGPVGIAAAALLGVKTGTDLVRAKMMQTAIAEDKVAAREITEEQRKELSKTADGRAVLAQLATAQEGLDKTGSSVSALEARDRETFDEFSGAEEDDLRRDTEENRDRRETALASKQTAIRTIELLEELTELNRQDAADAKRAAADAAGGPVLGIAGTDLDPDAVAANKKKRAAELAKRRKDIAKLRKKIQDKGKEGGKKKKKDEKELTFGELLGLGKGGANVSSTEGRGLGTTIVNQTFNIGVPSIKIEVTAAPGATVRGQAEKTAEVVANLGPELLKRTQRAAVGALS